MKVMIKMIKSFNSRSQINRFKRKVKKRQMNQKYNKTIVIDGLNFKLKDMYKNLRDIKKNGVIIG